MERLDSPANGQHSSLKLRTRDGRTLGVSPFNSDTNYNVLMAGGDAAGREDLMNRSFEAALRQGDTVVVLGQGQAFADLAGRHGGTVINVGNECGTGASFNPFSRVAAGTDHTMLDNLDLLAGIVASMAEALDGPLDEQQHAHLRRAVCAVWLQHQRSTTMDLIAQHCLDDQSPDQDSLRDLGKRLYAFTSAGPWGRYFSGENSLASPPLCTIVDIAGLQEYPAVQRVILLAALYQVLPAGYFAAQRAGRRTHVAIHGVEELLLGTNTPHFLDSLYLCYRRARTYQAAVWTEVGSLLNLSGPGGRLVFNSSHNLYLLAERQGAVDALRASREIDLGSEIWDLLDSMVSEDAGDREVLILPAGHIDDAVGRLVDEPTEAKYSYVELPQGVFVHEGANLFASCGKDAAAIERAQLIVAALNAYSPTAAEAVR
jgi:conjugal transfer ATP-binding protein TraC